MNKVKTYFVSVVMMLLSGTALAEGFGLQNVYLGGGIAQNMLDKFENATGYQLFAGYAFEQPLGALNAALELGYMNSGEFSFNSNIPAISGITIDARGIWASGVFSYPVNESVDLLGRVGFDFGEDDGLLMGVGAAYTLFKNISLRGEYVKRQELTSYQLNLVYALD